MCSSTGQIGSILLRKTEKVKQGVRVEFVCGLRAVATARRDFQTLTEAASVFSTHIWDVPEASAQSSWTMLKAAQKIQQKLLEEVAELQATNLLRCRNRPSHRQKAGDGILRRPRSRLHQDAGAEVDPTGQCAVLLGCGGAQPSLVFAQTPGLTNDMGALMKQTMQKLGTRGGGNSDMAQGGAPDADSAEQRVRRPPAAIG